MIMPRLSPVFHRTLPVFGNNTTEKARQLTRYAQLLGENTHYQAAHAKVDEAAALLKENLAHLRALEAQAQALHDKLHKAHNTLEKTKYSEAYAAYLKSTLHPYEKSYNPEPQLQICRAELLICKQIEVEAAKAAGLANRPCRHDFKKAQLTPFGVVFRLDAKDLQTPYSRIETSAEAQ